ncbi:MAG: hypothetical protein JNK40_11440 [Chromatiales bacterium]|nr:hypothetical protein [Chromatiales bacterium]
MTESKHTPWVRHLDAIGDELMRLSIACDLRLRDPGVIDRILKNDDTVCGTRNPIGFQKLQSLVKATFSSVNKSVDRIGLEETQQITQAIIERLDRNRAIGGTGPKQ